jgi:glycosyltransferase involved in cell wall biosynthesis
VLDDELTTGVAAPEKETLGAASLRAAYLARALAELGHETWLTCKIGTWQCSAGAELAKAWTLHPLHRALPPFDAAIANRNWYLHERVAAVQRYVWTGDDGNCIFKERRWARCREARVVVTSAYLKHTYERHGVTVHAVIPTGVRDELHGLLMPNGSLRQQVYVCGVWDAVRRVEDCIDAYVLAARRVQGLVLHLFGGPELWGRDERDPYAAALRRKIERVTEDCNRIEVHGTVPHAQMVEEIGGVGVLLHLTTRETCGVAVREAMMAGRPVVGTHACALAEIATWPEVTGVGAASDDLVRVVTQDSVFRDRSGRGRRMAGECGFGWSSVGRQWGAILR